MRSPISLSLRSFIVLSEKEDQISNPNKMHALVLVLKDSLNRESGSKVQHANIQASKSMIEISRTQDEEVGDGLTSVIVLAGEMLHVAEAFIDKNLSSYSYLPSLQ